MHKKLFLGGLVLASLAAFGCGGKKSGGSGIQVTGTVLTYDNVPVANAQVLVNGTLATTDATGTFSVAKVATPYTIALNDTASSTVSVYVGATRPDPVLRSSPPATARSASLSGSMSPMSGIGLGFVTWAGSLYLNAPTPSTGPDSFTTTATWVGATTSTGKLTGVRYNTDASGIVNSITSYGSLDVSVSDGVAQTSLSLPVSAVTTGSASASVQLPPGYTNKGLTGALIDPIPSIALSLGTTTNATATFTDIADANFGVALTVAATPPGATSGADGFSITSATATPNSSTVLPVVAIPAITTPAASATLAHGDAVSWTPGNTGSDFVLGFFATAGGKAIQIHTLSPSVTLPDLSAFGAIGASTAYDLSVVESKPSRTIDDQLAATPPTGGTMFQYSASKILSVTASF